LQGQPYRLDQFADFIPDFIAQFKTGDAIGAYSYRKGRRTPDLYGSSDMLMLLYTIGALELTEPERASWIETLQSFQDPKTGWFKEKETWHFKEHSTAYCTAALHLLGAKPKYPFNFMAHLNTQKQIEHWLNGMRWSLAWPTSHRGSGVAAVLAMTGEAPEGWFSWIFEWLERRINPKTGYWQFGWIHKLFKITSKHEMGGSFHFYYIYEFLKRPLPYPERIVDTSLKLQHSNGLWDKNVPYCIDLDGVYTLTRASKAAQDYRKADVVSALEKTLHTIVPRLNDKTFVFQNYTNSHRLVGALAALAEIQNYLPERVATAQKWKLVLDHSPYI
jgi:hypothetical protein